MDLPRAGALALQSLQAMRLLLMSALCSERHHGVFLQQFLYVTAAWVLAFLLLESLDLFQ